MVALFSFAVMMSSPDGRMSSDCLFSIVGTSLCPQGALAVAIHHISAYQSFFNVFVNFSLTATFFGFLFLIMSAILVLYISPPLFKPAVILDGLDDFPLAIPHNKKITRWLSLLENSPSS